MSEEPVGTAYDVTGKKLETLTGTDVRPIVTSPLQEVQVVR